MSVATDRLFLDDCNPQLVAKLNAKRDDPNMQISEQDLQDFEMSYLLATEGTALSLRVRYPFLDQVLRHGSQDLFERLWEGRPDGSMKLSVDKDQNSLTLVVDLSAGDETARKHAAVKMAATRITLLIGPLVERLKWLQSSVNEMAAVAKAAPPGEGSNAAAKHAAQMKIPPMAEIQLRQMETMWLVTKPDRVVVIMSVSVEDDVDVALGRAFCQEFAETNRSSNASTFQPPCSFNETKEMPADIRGVNFDRGLPNVGFISLTLTDQSVKGMSEDRLHALARPVMTFRIFFLFHLKHAKAYLHSRLRKRLDQWALHVAQTRRSKNSGKETRRLASGKVFSPGERA
jgi:hypothetical protein